MTTVSATTAYASSSSYVNCFEKGIIDGQDHPFNSTHKHTAGVEVTITEDSLKDAHRWRIIRWRFVNTQQMPRNLFSYFIAVGFRLTISFDDKASS
jgi:hypothetical protein